MKIEFWVIGKTSERYLEEGIKIYRNRLPHYLPFQMQVLPEIKKTGKLNPAQLKQKEGQAVLERLKKGDHLLLLDERGKSFSSREFARFLEKKLQLSAGRLIFLGGGAFGFSDAVYDRANGQIALSRMTFSHQMVRLFFLEQLYRGMSILRGEKYHND